MLQMENAWSTECMPTIEPRVEAAIRHTVHYTRKDVEAGAVS